MKFEKTKEDWCFEDEIRTIGYWYYTNDLVTNVSKKKNVYSCNVDKYNTLIKFSNKYSLLANGVVMTVPSSHNEVLTLEKIAPQCWS